MLVLKKSLEEKSEGKRRGKNPV